MDKKNKIIMTSGISVASIALLATIISAFHTPKAPDPKELGPRTKISYMASKDFAKLSEEEKTKYVSKVGRPTRQNYAKLSSVERKAVFKNTRKIMFKKMKERVDKFFKMSEEEQNKILDDMIARGNKWRAARKTANNSGGKTAAPSAPRRGGNRNAMMQGILEKTDSTTRAKMMEFFRRMQARRKQTQGK